MCRTRCNWWPSTKEKNFLENHGMARYLPSVVFLEGHVDHKNTFRSAYRWPKNKEHNSSVPTGHFSRMGQRRTLRKRRRNGAKPIFRDSFPEIVGLLIVTERCDRNDQLICVGVREARVEVKGIKIFVHMLHVYSSRQHCF